MRGNDFMRFIGLPRRTLIALLAAIVLPLAAGCGGNPFNPPPDDGDGGLPDDTPLNDNPQNTMVRFERTYEYQVLPEYEKLFAANFRFIFSNQTDPDLVTRYGENWGKPDEIESTGHLFDGFTNGLGESVPGATRIDMRSNSPTFGDHPGFDPDSAAFYEWVVLPRLELDIEVPGSPEPLIYTIDARQEFYLVRGDIAVLDAGQEARTDRWYIYRWDDLSQPLAGPSRLAALDAGSLTGTSTPTTWGATKDRYTRRF